MSPVVPARLRIPSNKIIKLAQIGDGVQIEAPLQRTALWRYINAIIIILSIIIIKTTAVRQTLGSCSKHQSKHLELIKSDAVPRACRCDDRHCIEQRLLMY